MNGLHKTFCPDLLQFNKETDSPLKILPLQNDKLDYVYDHCLNLSLVNINKYMCEGQFFPDRRCRALWQVNFFLTALIHNFSALNDLGFLSVFMNGNIKMILPCLI